MVRPPLWQLPPGVSPGTWDYTHQSAIADGYDAVLRDTPLVQLDLRLTRRHLPPPGQEATTVIADLGCGNGRSAIPLAADGYRVLGIDLSQSMLRRARAAAAEAGVEMDVLRANLVQLEAVADASVDHAICLFSTLGMIRGRKNRRRFLAHCHRILRPGGRLLVHAHHRRAWLRHPGGLKRLATSLWYRLRRTDHEFGDWVYAYRGLSDMFLHSFSRGELKADVRHAGLRIDHLLRLDIRGERVLSRFAPEIAGGFFVVASKR